MIAYIFGMKSPWECSYKARKQTQLMISNCKIHCKAITKIFLVWLPLFSLLTIVCSAHKRLLSLFANVMNYLKILEIEDLTLVIIYETSLW